MRPQKEEPFKAREFNLIKDITKAKEEKKKKNQAKPRQTSHRRNILIAVEQFHFAKGKRICFIVFLEVLTQQ